MDDKPVDDQRKFQLAGWLLFIICALFYLASSWQNQDALAITGSIVFLLACIVFLLPLMASRKTAARDSEAPGKRDNAR